MLKIKVVVLIGMSVISSHLSWAQEEVQFENHDLLSLRYVDPQACDYPSNLTFFYTYDEFEKLKFSGTVSPERLIAKRTWREVEYKDDSLTLVESIVIEFGDSDGDFRNIKSGSYVRWAFFDDADEDAETDEFLIPIRAWQVHEASIDYTTMKMNYTFQRFSDSEKMHLEIVDPVMEQIDFFYGLCYFYDRKNNERTTFSITESE
ncbi:MAG: hypothetical protein ACI837_002777 [Crocinitomicaceae bacterium]|jgi:hypothetical protein